MASGPPSWNTTTSWPPSARPLSSCDVETLRTVLDGTTRALISYMLAESDRSPDDIASGIARLLVAVLQSDQEVPS